MSEDLERWFDRFRRGIVGIDQTFRTPYGVKKIVYADWTASGRLYGPIERRMLEQFGPFVGNTHSEANVTGGSMTLAYGLAHRIIKRHVNACPDDVILHVGYGMTSAIIKLQRLMGLKVPEWLRGKLDIREEQRPVVFVTHMEHHSNHTPWYETIAEVCIIRPTADGLPDQDDLREQLRRFEGRATKIGSFTACSNVTGIRTPYHALARIVHEHGGVCFVDFAASAPYEPIDMHPPDPLERLDAIVLSPHKFLGGPGASGVLVFDSKLYKLESPDQPGGGTVLWTNPWGECRFYPEIEVREDGGTPGFLQAVKAALAVELKQQMDPAKMHLREDELCSKLMEGLRRIPDLHILADHVEDRLPIVSFYIDGIHYNLVVKLLDQRFGVQARGGCSCAGTYGHYLLHMDRQTSSKITSRIDHGDLSSKPGWVRIALHPTMTDTELDLVVDAVAQVRANAHRWIEDYLYRSNANEFVHRLESDTVACTVEGWFDLD